MGAKVLVHLIMYTMQLKGVLPVLTRDSDARQITKSYPQAAVKRVVSDIFGYLMVGTGVHHSVRTGNCINCSHDQTNNPPGMPWCSLGARRGRGVGLL